MSLQEIPITSDPNQKFQCSLTIDGINRLFQFSFRFNEMAGYWVMTVSDPMTGAYIIDGVPLIPNNDPDRNILSQYAYMRIGSAYVVNVSSVEEYPTSSNMGTAFKLIWGDTPNA